MLSIAAAYYAVGVTAGDVIRYSVPDEKYVKSKADELANSEVVGIVESKSGDSLNVVIYGSILLPATSIEATTPSSDTTTGGGGNDIYFLSSTTAGKVRVTAPTGQTDIIKPIYQVSPHGLGAYTGIVMNYIGYKIGGDVQAYLQGGFDGGVGTISTVISGALNGTNTQLPTFYVDASISHVLPISEYPAFWNRYVKSFGYQDILLTDIVANASYIGQRITPLGGSNYSGRIIGTLPTVSPNAYLVERPPNGLTGNPGEKISINSVTHKISYTTENFATRTPKVVPTGVQYALRTSNDDVISNTIITGIKVAGDGTTLTVPESISITSITTEALVLGATGDNYDLDTTIQDHTTRLVALENKVGL
jgi:hypothetical protein